VLQKDGSPLPPGRHSIEEGNLTISEVAEEDRGVYVCAAHNDAAAVAAEAELLVENLPPRAPHNLTARPAADSLHLSWVPGTYAALASAPPLCPFTFHYPVSWPHHFPGVCSFRSNIDWRFAHSSSYNKFKRPDSARDHC
jgi:hypothetical protein